MDRQCFDSLHAARAAEQEQARFYHLLELAAQETGDEALADRVSGLHADEQHQFARLTARLIELGEPLQDVHQSEAVRCDLGEWQEVARAREQAEVERYEALLQCDLDSLTGSLVEEILHAERQHQKELSGKWMGV